MTTNTYKRNHLQFLRNVPINRGMAFGVIIITALLAFEVFNYGTTDYALSDLLGDLKFLGVRWATILAIAFCGIDFAGIARLFSPEGYSNKAHTETWYLFGAWLLAATMNAMLTWWGVSLAILNHQTLGNAVIERETLLRAVPIFVSILVWLIRVLIIGTFSVAGESLFNNVDERSRSYNRSTSQRSTQSSAIRGSASPAPQAHSLAARSASSQRNFSSQRTGTQGSRSSMATRDQDTSNRTYTPVSPNPGNTARPPQQPQRTYTRPEPEYTDPDLTLQPAMMKSRTPSQDSTGDPPENFPKQGNNNNQRRRYS